MTSVSSRRRGALALGFCVFGLVGCGGSRSESPAANLNGTYTSTVPASGFEGADPEEFLPSIFGGDWELVIDGTTYRLEADNFNGISGRIVATADSIRFEDVPAPRGAFNCADDAGERVLSRAEGTGIYEYDLAEGTLTLRVTDEPCELRGLIMEREWELDS